MDRRAFAHETMLRYRDEIVRVMQDLIRIPSRNTPPVGEEKAAQGYIAGYLQTNGLPAEVYEPDGLEVEFVAASGRTQALVTLRESDVRHVDDRDLIAVRPLQRAV